MERCSKIANGVAAIMLIMGFSLLLAALIKALRINDENYQADAKKISWQNAEGRMGERTQSTPFLWTDDESDATLAIMANDEEVDGRIKGEPILITNEEESDEKMRKDEKESDVRKTEIQHESAVLLSVTDNVLHTNKTKEIGAQMGETAEENQSGESRPQTEIQALKPTAVTRYDQCKEAKHEHTHDTHHELRRERGISPTRVELTAKRERQERYTEIRKPRRIQAKI